MAHPMLPEWPIVDPDAPPPGNLLTGHHVDKDRDNTPWDFFISDQHFLLVSKEWVKISNIPGQYVTEQYEYPLAGARWFLKTLDRFFLPPDHPDAVSREAITIEEDVMGEVLGVTRGASYGDIAE